MSGDMGVLPFPKENPRQSFGLRPRANERVLSTAYPRTKKKPIGLTLGFFLVEIWGFEPQTYTLRTYRATNCAISPKIDYGLYYIISETAWQALIRKKFAFTF